MSTSLRIIKDGDNRLIAVYEGFDKSEQRQIYELLHQAALHVQIGEVRNLRPAEKEPDEKKLLAQIDTMPEDMNTDVLVHGPYKGQSFSAVLLRYGVKGLAYLFKEASDTSIEIYRSKITAECKRYMKNNLPLLLSDQAMKVEQKKEIIYTLAPMVDICKIIRSFGGYRDLDSFLRYASDDGVKQAFDTILNHLIQRASRL